MSRAKLGDTVKVHYKGLLEDGTVFDSSEGRDPLEFTIGEGKIITSFEDAVCGMTVGESKIENIPAGKAYGLRNEELVIEVDKNQLPINVRPHIGLELQIKQTDGRVTPVAIVALDEAKATLDANHPLAGKDLIFHIDLLNVATLN